MNVLIVKLTSMGDLVQALPAVTDVARARPDVVLDWVVDEAFAEVPRWHPFVRGVITTAHRRWRDNFPGALRSGELAEFRRRLREQRYDAVIDAQTNLKSALVTALARGPKHGPDGATAREYPAHWAYRHRYHLPLEQLAIDRWRRLFSRVLDYPLPDSPPDFGIAGNHWPVPEDVPAEKYLVAVPNASWDNKYWLDRHWRDLIALAGEHGYQVLLSCGSSREFERSAAIADGLDNARALPKKSLTGMAAVLRQSEGAICMDTGLAHVSAALDVPTVTLYGPTDPRLIGATGNRSGHIVATGYDCIPCYRRECVVPGYRGKVSQCLARIEPAQVWRVFSRLTGETRIISSSTEVGNEQQEDDEAGFSPI